MGQAWQFSKFKDDHRTPVFKIFQNSSYLQLSPKLSMTWFRQLPDFTVHRYPSPHHSSTELVSDIIRAFFERVYLRDIAKIYLFLRENTGMPILSSTKASGYKELTPSSRVVISTIKLGWKFEINPRTVSGPDISWDLFHLMPNISAETLGTHTHTEGGGGLYSQHFN